MPGERVVAETLPDPLELDALLRRYGAEEALPYLGELSWLRLVAFAASRQVADPPLPYLTYPLFREYGEARNYDLEETRAGWELLLTGRLNEFLPQVTRHLIRSTGRIPPEVEALLRHPPFGVEVKPDVFDPPTHLPETVWAQLWDDFRVWRGQTSADRLHYRRDLLFRDTLRRVYEQASAGAVCAWADEITGLRSVQLALLVYAEFNGVALRLEDIEGVRQALRAGDLTALIEAGLAFFAEQGPDAAYRFLTD
ncbi:MAG: hypothetical protein AAF430_01540 [Myxococcota bacterium]